MSNKSKITHSKTNLQSKVNPWLTIIPNTQKHYQSNSKRISQTVSSPSLQGKQVYLGENEEIKTNKQTNKRVAQTKPSLKKQESSKTPVLRMDHSNGKNKIIKSKPWYTENQSFIRQNKGTKLKPQLEKNQSVARQRKRKIMKKRG